MLAGKKKGGAERWFPHTCIGLRCDSVIHSVNVTKWLKNIMYNSVPEWLITIHSISVPEWLSVIHSVSVPEWLSVIHSISVPEWLKIIMYMQ